MAFSIITLKAFGDFVIACNSVQAVQISSGSSNIHRPVVVAGEYVRQLAAALGVESDVEFIGDKRWIDVPAAFDVRKRGVLPALQSLMELRSILGKFPKNREFVFDNAGLREFFLCPNRKLHSISKNYDNIYISYQKFFKLKSEFVVNNFSLSRVKKVIVIPGSRVPLKIIPKHTIDAIHLILKEHGYIVTIVTLENEHMDFPEGVRRVVIPKTFENLIAKIRESDFVIAADSLPSHIGEFFKIPQFIFTPNKVNFMLPQSVHQSNAWATFDNSQKFAHWLDTHP